MSYIKEASTDRVFNIFKRSCKDTADIYAPTITELGNGGWQESEALSSSAIPCLVSTTEAKWASELGKMFEDADYIVSLPKGTVVDLNYILVIDTRRMQVVDVKGIGSSLSVILRCACKNA